MAIKLADCVRETTTTTGTGTLTLTGSAPAIGDRTFSTSVTAAGVDDLTDGCTTVVRIEAVDGSGIPTGDWEITEGVYTVSGNTVTRGTLKSSSTGSRVNFSAGTKYVSVVVPSSMMDVSGGIPSSFTSRALTDLDNTNILICATAQVATVNTGLVSGFGCSFKGAVSFAGTATVTDVRTTGATNPWCALIQTGTNTYDCVGGTA